MGVVRFVNGFASRESDKITYFIPAYSSTIVPVDLTVLEVADLRETKETGRKYYEAYKANITGDDLRDWKLANTDQEGDRAAECLKEALNGQGEYEVELKSPEKRPTLAFKKIVDKKKVPLGEVSLEKIEIIPSTGRLLETVILNLVETAEENHRIRDEDAKTKAKQVKIEKNYEDLVKAKFQLEDKMTRAFTRCLNTKKERIVQLEKEITKLKKKLEERMPGRQTKNKAGPSSNPSRMSTLMGMSSSDSEAEKLSDQEATTDYDEETDVQDSDDQKKTVKSTVAKNSGPSGRSKIQVPKNVVEKSSESPKTGCRKNLFPVDEPASGTPAITRPRRKKANYSQSTDSQTDSSQEFFLPTPKVRKVPAPKRMAKRTGTKANSNVETTEKSSDKPSDPPQILPEEDKVDEPNSKKSRSDEDSNPVRSPPDSDNDEILNAIFAFDSQS